MIAFFSFLLAALSSVGAQPPDDHPAPLRDVEVVVHGFRAPVTGIEVRDDVIGLHLGAYPILVGMGADSTSWYVKMGLSLYPWSLESPRGRRSGPYAAASLLQGLTGARAVAVDVDAGTGVQVEAGWMQALGTGLELRLGIAALRTDGLTSINPTPGISWSVPLGGAR